MEGGLITVVGEVNLGEIIGIRIGIPPIGNLGGMKYGIWGGEFGRTVYSQGKLSRETYGRDHHPKNFCMWMAGGGIKGGTEVGETDEFSYNPVKDKVHINEINATALHCLGIDHERFTLRHQGLDERLTGVESRKVIRKILA